MTRSPFRDRDDAARELAVALARYRNAAPVVLAIPRGAVPMGRIVADALGGELDVVLVRKLGAPNSPELAIGAVDEGGRVILNDAARLVGVGSAYVHAAAEDARATLRARRARYSGARAPVDIRGRTVVVLDDGLATGSTMAAALQAVRQRAPSKLVCATPVASLDALREVSRLADEVVCLSAPARFGCVAAHYRDFAQVSDDEVVAALGREAPAARGTRSVEVPAGGIVLPADLVVPDDAHGLVVFVHGSGSSRTSPRNRFVAHMLGQAGFATLLFDLLTREEDTDVATRFDVRRLATRLGHVLDWVATQPQLHGLPLGLFGASTGSAAALVAAAEHADEVSAVVSRGGRPDLAGRDALQRVRAPTLLIVGAADTHVIELNREALEALTCEARLDVVPGAGHLFEQPGTLEAAARRAVDWFERHAATQVGLHPAHGARSIATPAPRRDR